MLVKSLPRNTRVKPVRVGWTLDAPTKDTFDACARRHGISTSAFLDALAVHLNEERGETGELPWLPAPLEYAEEDEQLEVAI